MEHRLVESERRLSSVLESVQAAIIIIDPEVHRIVELNPFAARMIGASKESIFGAECHKYICPAEKGQCPVTDLHQTIDNSERVLLTANGKRLDILKTVTTVKLGGRVHLLESFVDISERKRTEWALRRTNRALQALSAGNELLIHAQSEQQLLKDLCQLMVKTTGFRLAWIGYVEHDAAKSVRLVAHFGADDGYIEALQISWADTERGQGPTGRAVRSGRPEFTRDIRNDPKFAPWREQALQHGFASNIVLPLRKDSEVFGVFSIYAAEPNAFDKEEVKLLAELADDLAFGIVTLRTRIERDSLQQHQLLDAERLKSTLIDTIGAVAMTVEKRDPYTAGHQQRVVELCVAIGQELDWTEDQLEGLRLGASIHDIGKIYVPSEILSRPGKLTVFEFEIIKTHPQVGYDIIKDVKFPWPVADMILQHHERLDGSGYPQGLKDEQIVFEAKILAVADVVEAMASHRPYRPGLGIEEALAEIERGRGSAYDPAVADACVKLFHERGFAFQKG